jgi:hypothetical protein
MAKNIEAAVGVVALNGGVSLAQCGVNNNGQPGYQYESVNMSASM